MPPGVLAVVVQLVVNIPAKDTITKTTSLTHEAGELIQTDILATDHTINIREA